MTTKNPIVLIDLTMAQMVIGGWTTNQRTTSPWMVNGGWKMSIHMQVHRQPLVFLQQHLFFSWPTNILLITIILGTF